MTAKFTRAETLASPLLVGRWRLAWLPANQPFSAAFSGVRDWIAQRPAIWHASNYVAGLASISLITLFYLRVASVNATTVGFTFLLAILSASALWGLGVSAAMSVAATLAFDYFYLPPTGSLNIADTQDSVALLTFLVTSVLGSSLAAHARRQALEANLRRREVEQLYDLSQRMSGAATLSHLAQATPQNIVESFGLSAAAVFLCDRDEVYRTGTNSTELDSVRMKAAAEGQDVRVEGESLLSFAPLRLGSKVIGSVGISGPAFSATALRALGGLIAVSIERANAIERMAKMAALRESEQFKSVLLDAITHDFRTPLTCIKSSVTGLLGDLEFDAAQKKEMLTVIDEECDRINQLLDKASEMARLECNEVRLKLAPHSVGELISAAVADCKAISRSRPMRFEIRNQECHSSIPTFRWPKVCCYI
jgi:two-component system, OmpR family, sensor histidine kinase KdpD